MSPIVRRRWLFRCVICSAVAGVAIAVSLAEDAEPKPLELNQVPKAVINAVLKKYPDAKPHCEHALFASEREDEKKDIPAFFLCSYCPERKHKRERCDRHLMEVRDDGILNTDKEEV